MPCVYIRAENDRLLSGSHHAEEFRIIAPHIKLIDIPGPHFILQARPEDCAQVVKEYIELAYIDTTRQAKGKAVPEWRHIGM